MGWNVALVTWWVTFLVTDMQLYKRFCPSVGPLVCRSVEVIEMKTRKTCFFDALFGIMWVCERVGGSWGWGWGWVEAGVGCPCPPIRNNIVTPRHLLKELWHGAPVEQKIILLLVRLQSILFFRWIIEKFFTVLDWGNEILVFDQFHPPRQAKT